MSAHSRAHKRPHPHNWSTSHRWDDPPPKLTSVASYTVGPTRYTARIEEKLEPAVETVNTQSLPAVHSYHTLEPYVPVPQRRTSNSPA